MTIDVEQDPAVVSEASTVADAVERIDRVLSQPEVETDLRSHVRARREQFTASRFCAELRSIVEEF